jgi:hypothetical protein
VGGDWGVESMHWLLDVVFKHDLSRYRIGHGGKNMAVARRFALGLIRANKDKGSVKPAENEPAGTRTSDENPPAHPSSTWIPCRAAFGRGDQVAVRSAYSG